MDAALRTRCGVLRTALGYYGGRLARRPQARLDELAARSVTVCPAGQVPAITPFFWQEQLPRIRGAVRATAKQVIEEHLHRKTFVFTPVVAHWLRDAVLLDGSVYAGHWRHELRANPSKWRPSLVPLGAAAECREGALASTCAGSNWYGHFIEDEIPYQMLASTFGPLVAHERPAYSHEPAYRRMLDLAEPARYGAARFEQLVVIDEFAQNPDKTRRYQAIRSKFARHPRGRERVFLMRGDSGARRVLVDEAELALRLEQQGFALLDVRTATAEQIVATCRGARTIVSVEGSHLAPALYLLQDGGCLVILNPPYQTHVTVADIGVFCGLSSGMFICTPHGQSRTDFAADADEVIRFVEDVERHATRQAPQLAEFVRTVIDQGARTAYA